MIWCISSFEIINVVVPEPRIFFPVPPCAADSAAFNHNGIKTLVSNDMSKFLTIGKPIFNNIQEVYQEIHLIILFKIFLFLIILY